MLPIHVKRRSRAAAKYMLRSESLSGVKGYKEFKNVDDFPERGPTENLTANEISAIVKLFKKPIFSISYFW